MVMNGLYLCLDMSLEELENCNPQILQEKSFHFCFKKLN